MKVSNADQYDSQIKLRAPEKKLPLYFISKLKNARLLNPINTPLEVSEQCRKKPCRATEGIFKPFLLRTV